MKKLLLILSLIFASTFVQAQVNKKSEPNNDIKAQNVEISCGQCNFKMEGHSCDLAIRLNGKPYFVDDKNIDDFGDAHGKFGFCNAIRSAEVTGQIINNRFKAKEIKLHPIKEN